MTQEALKLALEALEYMSMTAERYVDNRIPETAITAIKEALREHAMREVQRLGQEIEQSSDYERGFIDGMQKQMQSSVDKAVNALSQRTWVGLEEKDMPDGEDPMFDDKYFIAGMVYAANKLMEKNT
jgi:hypothetical protein